MKPSILIVEDDATLCGLLCKELGKVGYEPAAAHSWAEARTSIAELAPDLVLLDVNLPDSSGFGPLAEIAESRPVVMLTAYGSIHQAVEAMRLGAADYLTKPVNLDELELVIRHALERSRLRAEHERRRSESGARYSGGMVGDSPSLREVRRLVAAVAPTDKIVLIHGESGVGKELVAHAIHDASLRRDGNFVALDCTTLQESLFESELFGHEKGAFTGADRRKPGLIEVAAGGTLFLDEIGELGPAIQAKLLRAIETGRFRRVGATSDLRSNARIVTATNRNLAQMVGTGGFRADLYYRLMAFAIEVPPLRARRDDIPMLAQNFLARAAEGGTPKRLSSASLALLLDHAWPGNVRELRNMIERASILAGDAEEIGPQHLTGLVPLAQPTQQPGDGLFLHGEPTLDEIERAYLQRLLQKHEGNRRRVAQALGVSERTAYRMLERHSLK
jgi:DNA-binding NtrC family response regulator